MQMAACGKGMQLVVLPLAVCDETAAVVKYTAEGE